MTASFVSVADVRGYLATSQTSDSFSDGNIGSNIRAASAFLQRETGRQFEAETGTTKLFTTDGRAVIPIPDLRTLTSATLQGATLTADASYWLLSDALSGTYTAIQVRAFGQTRTGYLSNPEWFDRGLDIEWGRYSTLPNDLSLTGDWGYTTYPEELSQATKVLAAFYTLRPQTILANVRQTPEGAILDYSGLPEEVQRFLSGWKVGSVQAVAL